MGSCLRETMDSLLAQRYEQLEIVCIDDGSTDDSLAILQDYAARDARISVRTQSNAGQGAARNAGLDLATGEYVLLLDADDIYEPAFVERMVQRAQEVDADVVVCRSDELDDATGRISPALWTVNVAQLPVNDPFDVTDMYDFIFTAFVGWPWDKIYKRSFLADNDLRFPDLANSEDLHFVFLSLVKARRISFLDETLIHHRMGRAGSVSNSRLRAPMEFYEAICLLKQQLLKDKALYDKLEWGFLNWAFDYAVWNIDTMTDADTQRTMLLEVMSGRCPELELFEHSQPFFNLEPNCLQSLRRLLAQTGLSDESVSKRRGDAHPRLLMPIAFFEEARVMGYGHAFGKMVSKLKRGRFSAHKTRGRRHFEQLPDDAQVNIADTEGEDQHA